MEEIIVNDNILKKGDIVEPVTKAGLWLGDVPCDSTYKQVVKHACVLKGYGTILETKDIIIDYDSWEDSKYDGLGKIVYRNCLVLCDDGGKGWAGEGAIRKV